MTVEQPASPGRPVLNPPDTNQEEKTNRKAEAGNAAPGKSVRPDATPAVSQSALPAAGDAALPAVSHEVLAGAFLKLMNKLSEDEPKPPRYKRFLAHPLSVVLVTFLLSILLGGYLTNVYSLRQQELARQRSFTDELNKIRVQKIGEVWEHIDRTELDLDALLDKTNKTNAPSDQELDTIYKLVKEDVAVVDKNRFWLGEHNYKQLKSYLEINGRYTVDRLLGGTEKDLTETIKKRDQAKQDVLKIRYMFLKGELEP